MARFGVVLTREITVVVTVSAKDEDAAALRAIEFAAEHIEVEPKSPPTRVKSPSWEPGDDQGAWAFCEIHDA